MSAASASPRPTPHEASIARGAPLAEETGIGPLTLAGYLREVTGRFGPREAACIGSEGGMVRWSYDDLWRKSLEVARALVACGVAKGARVGVMSTNRLEFISAFFGAALAGAVAAPLSTFSTPSELEALLELSSVSVLLFERRVLNKDFAQILFELEPHIGAARPGEVSSLKFPFLRHVAMMDSDEGAGAVEGWSAFLARAETVAPDLVEARASQVAPSDPGALFFSSGSTGKPKGVLSSHRGICLQLWRWKKWHNIPEVVRTFSANGLFWSGSFAMSLGGAFSGGGTLVLLATFQPDEALRLIQAEKVSLLLAWPHQWALLEEAPGWAGADLSSLRYISCLVPVNYHPTISTDWKEPRHAYGNTETFTFITGYPSGTADDITKASHGVPTPAATIKIVDPLTGATVPLGERGELCVKGPTLMLGYVGVPLDETLDDEGFLHTGDGGRLDRDGRLYWEGRLNDIIKTGGANVSPLEVDAVIRDCPGVKICQTVGVPDRLLGELVVACIVPQEGAKLDAETVRAFTKEKLASYKTPRRVLFLAETDLKTTGSAKIKTDALRELAIKLLAEPSAPA